MITTLCCYRLPAANTVLICNADCAMRSDAIPLLSAKDDRRKCVVVESWLLADD